MTKKQQTSASFRSWFGDSKIVDDHGRPLVCYHGTAARTFIAFIDWRPAFFTTDRQYASEYTTKSVHGKGRGRVIAAYLSIQRPFDTRHEAHRQIYNEVFVPTYQNKFPRDADRYVPLKPGELQSFIAADQFFSFLKTAAREGRLDFDGFFVSEGGFTSAPSVVPLHPWQIKSATRNDGTFDSDDASIFSNPGAFDEDGSPRRDSTTVRTAILAEAKSLARLLHRAGTSSANAGPRIQERYGLTDTEVRSLLVSTWGKGADAFMKQSVQRNGADDLTRKARRFAEEMADRSGDTDWLRPEVLTVLASGKWSLTVEEAEEQSLEPSHVADLAPNSLLAQPPVSRHRLKETRQFRRLFGRPPRDTDYEGVHTTGSELIAAAYAMATWQQAGEGYPVILTLDVTGLTPEPDVDAMLRGAEAADELLKSYRREMAAGATLDDLIDDDDYTDVTSQVGDHPSAFVFDEMGLRVPQTIRDYAEAEGLDEDAVFRVFLETGILPPGVLTRMVDQQRYLNDFEPDRLVEVQAVRPWWDRVLMDSSDGDVQELIERGYHVFTLDEWPFTRPGDTKTVYEAPDLDRSRKVEYHRTVSTAVEAAFPGTIHKRSPFPIVS